MASFYAESGLECALVKEASGADHEPHPLTLRPESLQLLSPPRDAGENAVLVGRDGRGAGQSWVLGESPERGGISLRLVPRRQPQLHLFQLLGPPDSSKQQEEASEDPVSGILSPGFQVPAP